jgi:hypothetical protein
VKKRFVAISLSLSLLSTLFFPTSLSNAADPRGLIPQPANTARMIFADIPRGSGEFSYVNGVLGQHPKPYLPKLGVRDSNPRPNNEDSGFVSSLGCPSVSRL